MSTLANILDKLTVEGSLYERLPDNALRCFACGHRCLIREGRRGICQVRFNQGGELRVPWGYVAALQSDPIEKKPFYHVMPGSNALTFGMLGCDFHCGYCQNFLTSQAMRDPDCDPSINLVRRINPREMVDLAHRTKASVVVSSYNEPLITSEWAVDIFKEAKNSGLMCAYVSNGNNTPEVMEYIRPYISAYKVDLKCMQEKNYHKLGGVLKNTLDGIQRARELGLWVEIVTLVIPGFNDSNEELWDAARFIAGVSQDIPWHVTAFHKDYKMTDPDNTDARTLLRAAEIGREAGLRYVYAGNLPGQVDEYEHTFCSQCNELLIKRSGYVILEYHLNAAGGCPHCGTKLPGVWPQDPSSVRLNGYGIPIPVH
jgi:pyruvate formate lyase activating enzyme